MKIGKKLILNMVTIVLFSVVSTSILLGWTAYHLTHKALEKQVENQLTVIRDIKKYEIESYFSLLRDQVSSLANDRVVIEAAEELKKAFLAYPSEIQLIGSNISVKKEKINDYYNDFSKLYEKKTGYVKNTENLQEIFEKETPYDGLHFAYVIDNPNRIGQKYLLDSAAFPVSYNQIHRKYHIRLFDFLETFKVQDVFFIDPESSIVFYSVQKNLDFGLNVKEAAKVIPGLYQSFVEANNQKENEGAIVGDFTQYMPAMGDTRAFISAPVFDGDKKIAILVFQINIDRINSIMTNQTNWKKEGMGDTGETYLVGSDFRLRSMSRFFYEEPKKYLSEMQKINLSESLIKEMELSNSSIGIQPVLTEGSKEAHNDKTGFSIFKDYRDIPVLSAFAPLNIPNLDWIILSEIDVSEAFLPINQLFSRSIFSTIIVAISLSLVGIWFGRKLSEAISEPIQKFATLIMQVSNDLDLTKRISIKTDDELSDMAKALNHLFDRFQLACIQTVNSTKKMQETAAILKKLSEQKERVSPDSSSKKASSSILKEANKEKAINGKNQTVNSSDLSKDSEIAKVSENLEALSKKLSKVSNQFKIIQNEARRTREW